MRILILIIFLSYSAWAQEHGTKEGTKAFNILKWPKKNQDQYWYVESGVLKGN